MTLDPKDLVGGAVLLGALATVLVHNGPLGHAHASGGSVADAGGSVTVPVGEPATAFVDFNVVPMDRDVVLPRQIVIVRGQTIERIADVGSIEPPSGATIIQGDGTQYLAPGLTDAHVHLRARYETWLPLFLANGVTTVFNLEGRPGHLTLKRRIAAGEQEGPTVYTAGRFIGEPEVRTPADARAEVAQQAARGYDFVKVHGDLSAEAYRTLNETGREIGIPVIGHAPRNLPFSEVLSQRQVALSHAEELLQTELQTLNPNEAEALAARIAEAGIWIMPTLAHFDAVADQWGAPSRLEAALQRGEAAAYLPVGLREEWLSENVFLSVDASDRDRLQEMAEFHRPLLRALHDAGVPILAGTDTPIPTLAPGFSLHDEIQALHDAGLSAYEALATATTRPGVFVRSYVDADARFGTLQRGARADILLLDADPRTDLAALRRPRGVMARGVWYERADLDRMLRDVADAR